MLAMVTDPVTCTGLITAPVGGGAEIVRSATTHGQPVSRAVTEREPFEGPTYSGVCPTAPTPCSYTSRIRVLPAGLTPVASKLTRTWLPRSTTGGGAGGSSALVSERSGRPAAQLGRQDAIRANRCGSTARSTCPAPLPDRLVYSSTAVAWWPPGSIRSMIEARS